MLFKKELITLELDAKLSKAMQERHVFVLDSKGLSYLLGKIVI